MIKFLAVFFALMAAAVSALTLDSDQALQDKGRSFATSLDGTSQLHHLVALLQRSIQQADIDLLLNLFVTDISEDQSSYFSSEVVEPLIERLGYSPGPPQGWRQTDFSDFCLYVDSVSVVDKAGTLRVNCSWNSGDNRNAFNLAVSCTGFRWHLSSLADVLTLIDSYSQSGSDGRAIAEEGGVRKSSQIAIAEANQSDLMLNQVSFWQTPSVPRVTRHASRTRVQQGVDMFGCATSVSTYINIHSPDFTHDLMAVTDECWRRLIVMDDASEYMVGVGRRGSSSTLHDFAAPQGLEFMGSGFLYVTEDYNNRIKVISLNAAGNDKLYLFKIISLPELNRPMDLDVTLPGVGGERLICVANSGGNNILILEDREPGNGHVEAVLSSSSGSVGAFVAPTSVAFGRDPLTGEKNSSVFFIDSGGKRIVKKPYWDAATPCIAFTDFTDPHTNVSSIGVDNKGEVWVTDKGLGKIYKFTSQLVPIAQHGYAGSEIGEYQHPTSISFTQGWDQWNGQPLSNLGEVVLTEDWADSTGIRRLVPGTEIFDESIIFRPRTVGGQPAVVHGEYFISGYSNITEELLSPSGVVLETHQRLMSPSGPQTYWFNVNPAWPLGTYQVRITVASIYTNSNTDLTTLSVVVDNSIMNQPPVVTNIWFPDGDTCFVFYVSKWVRVGAYDPDGEVVGFTASVSHPGLGEVLEVRGDSISVVSQHSSVGVPFATWTFLRVQAIDNQDAASAVYSLNCSEITQYTAGQCPCTWQVGDPDFNHIVNISDAVYLITYVFGGGPAPRPVQMAGDADCNGIITNSDAVFLITFLFGGGPAPQCDCYAY